MALYISSLNSGSNGNCYYISNQHEAILVDVGISCKEVEKRLKRLQLDISKVKAIFISHEHSDHIKGLCVLVKKYQIPVYITPATLISCGFTLEEGLVNIFMNNQPIKIGSLSITAFPKLHDASDPYSFIIEHDNVRVGVFTDIGAPCQQLAKHFAQCNAAFLESNYCTDMLERGSYPYHLKRRISGGFGHLSNHQAVEIFKKHRPAFMTHLFLSHLSNNNNCPDLVRRLFSEHAGEVKIIVASRFEETPLYTIGAGIHHKRQIQKAAPQLAFAFG